MIFVILFNLIYFAMIGKLDTGSKGLKKQQDE